MATTGTFLREQFCGKMKDTTTRLDGRVAIITGSNGGLGYATAVHLAGLNPSHLILAVRNTSAGQVAAEKLRTSTGFKGQLEVWELDLASFASVKKFAQRCEIELSRLDIVIHNAAVISLKWDVTVDGWERALQTNDLSTGLLSLLLLPVLAKTAERYPEVTPHMSIVGSEVHMWAKFAEKKVPGPTLAALNTEKHFNPDDRYFTSKLIALFIARKLAKLPIASSVVVNIVNPGLCKSDLRREFPGPVQYISNKIARPAVEGAKNMVYAAVDCKKTGSYVSVCEDKEPSPYSTSREGLALEDKLWDELCAEWERIAPEVSRIS
ncbi:hypothetical protein MNV49_007088 [Pseudohyphozyma bogoriensis]|nr:hypothetical protein MNV49_007088 [Pseudohyphozyma bogoriensis]